MACSIAVGPLGNRLGRFQQPSFAIYPKASCYSKGNTLMHLGYVKHCAGSLALLAAATDEVAVQQEQYEFTEEDEEVLHELKHGMEDCCKYLLVAAGASLLATAVPVVASGAMPTFNGDELRQTAPVAAAAFAKVSAAALLFFSAERFEAVYKTSGNDIDHLLDGLRLLTNSMVELAILETAVSVLNVAIASSEWPETSIFLAGMLAFISFGRVVVYGSPSVLRVLRRLPLVVQQSIIIGLAPIMGREAVAATQRTRRFEKALERKASVVKSKPVEGQVASSSSSTRQQAQYEFAPAEDNVIRDLTSSLFFCAMSFWGAAVSTLLLGEAELHHGAPWFEMGQELFHFVDHFAVAVLLIRATGCFDKVILTRGNDIKYLMEGLGMECGMAKLFEELASVNRIVALLTGVRIAFIVAEVLH